MGRDQNSGGSSGGSAAAVAADECIASLGTDTGGSIRQPAALCGCVGLKPTYGRISRYGLVAFASSLDQIGPFTKDVRDAAILLGAMSGVDPRDSTSVPEIVPDYSAALTGDIRGMKLGLPKEYMIGGLDAEVKAAVDAAVKQYEKLGAEIVEISLPHTDYAWRLITSSRLPKRPQIWRASTAFVTARAWKEMIQWNFIPRRAARVLARR